MAQKPGHDLQANFASRLQSLVEEIRQILSRAPTAWVVHHCRSLFELGPWEAQAKFGLGSPYKQGMYMLGVMLTTPDPVTDEPLDPAEIERLNVLVRAATESYLYLLTPSREEIQQLEPGKADRYDTAGSAFLDYFFTGTLATGEQVRERSKTYFTPFERELKELMGLSGAEAIQIIEDITSNLQGRLDRFTEFLRQADQVQKRFRKGELPFEQASSLIPGGLPPDPLLLDKQHLTERFGSAADAFWRNFVVDRGSVEGFTYFTEENPLDLRPLIHAGSGYAYCPHVNALYVGVLKRLSKALVDCDATRDRFFRIRDKSLENRVVELLTETFGQAVQIVASATESSSGDFEHDVIVRSLSAKIK